MNENKNFSRNNPPNFLESKNLEKEAVLSGVKIENQPGMHDFAGAKVLKNFIFKKVLLLVLPLLFLGTLFLVLTRLKPKSPITSPSEKEIVWWGIQHDESVFLPLIEEFEKQNSGVKIKYVKKAQTDYKNILANALSSESGPDIFEIHNSWPLMFKNQLSTLPSQIMSEQEFKSSFYKTVVSDLNISGEGIIGMPLEFDALTLFINEDAFISSSQRPPQSWDEFRYLADTLTIKDDKDFILRGGASMGITQNVDHWPEVVALLLIQNKVDLLNPVGEASENALKFYRDFGENRVWSNALPPSTIAFANGKLAMYFGPSRRVSEIIKINPNLKFKTVRLPQVRKNLPTDPDFSYATYWVHSVSKKSKNKELAWRFLKFLSDPESLKKINENIKDREGFYRLYPRPDMNLIFREDFVLGSVASLADSTKSWYLADATFDGRQGINSQLKSAFEEVILKGIDSKNLANLATNIKSILSSYSAK